MKYMKCDCGEKIPEGWFRCQACADKAIMDPSKRNLPIGGTTKWRKPNGNYTPRP